jgi:hypothetical protein
MSLCFLFFTLPDDERLPIVVTNSQLTFVKSWLRTCLPVAPVLPIIIALNIFDFKLDFLFQIICKKASDYRKI